MVRHNNMISHQHFHKKWQCRVRTIFNDAAKKNRRKLQRQRKMKKIFPLPLGQLRPVVKCPSIRYNTKTRTGRGFTRWELKLAGISPKIAKTYQIPVDHRRKNCSSNTLYENTRRVRNFIGRVIHLSKNMKNVVTTQKIFALEKKEKKDKLINIDFIREESFKALAKFRLQRKLNKRRDGKKKKKVESMDMEGELKKNN